MTDEEKLEQAVNAIKDASRLYHEAAGITKAAKFVQARAVEAFISGEMKEATILRELSVDLFTEAESATEAWRQRDRRTEDQAWSILGDLLI